MKRVDTDLQIPEWLWIWVEWIGNNKAEIQKMTGFPQSSVGMVGGWARGATWLEDQSTHLDAEKAMVIDTAIDELSPGHKAAVLWVTGIQRVAKPNRLDERFDEAKGLIIKIMARKIGIGE